MPLHRRDRGHAGVLLATACAFLYWARSGFDLSPLEFVLVMGVMWAALVYVCLLGEGRLLRRELFAEGEGEEGGIGAILGVPKKIQEMLAPKLEKVSKNFAGETDDDEDRAADPSNGGDGKKKAASSSGSIKALNASSMQMPSAASDAEVKDMARAYKSIDYLLCRVKHRDRPLYDAVLKAA